MIDYTKQKKTIFPLKLSDALYADLKYVAKSEGIPVSVFVRSHLEPIIKKKLNVLRKPKKKMTFYEFAMENQYRGKIYHADKTDDELLYGGKLGDH